MDLQVKLEEFAWLRKRVDKGCVYSVEIYIWRGSRRKKVLLLGQNIGLALKHEA